MASIRPAWHVFVTEGLAACEVAIAKGSAKKKPGRGEMRFVAGIGAIGFAALAGWPLALGAA
jgi:hypothetical protein